MEKRLRECGSVGIVFGGEVPGEQFIDPVDRVLGDAGQDLAEKFQRSAEIVSRVLRQIV